MRRAGAEKGLYVASPLRRLPDSTPDGYAMVAVAPRLTALPGT